MNIIELNKKEIAIIAGGLLEQYIMNCVILGYAYAPQATAVSRIKTTMEMVGCIIIIPYLSMGLGSMVGGLVGGIISGIYEVLYCKQ